MPNPLLARLVCADTGAVPRLNATLPFKVRRKILELASACATGARIGEVGSAYAMPLTERPSAVHALGHGDATTLVAQETGAVLAIRMHSQRRQPPGIDVVLSLYCRTTRQDRPPTSPRVDS